MNVIFIQQPKKEPDDLEGIADAAPDTLLKVKANKKEKKRMRKDKDSSGCISGLPTRTFCVMRASFTCHNLVWDLVYEMLWRGSVCSRVPSLCPLF